MPIYHLSGHGDLFVEYQVILPPSLTSAQSDGAYCSLCFPFDAELTLASLHSVGEGVWLPASDEAAAVAARRAVEPHCQGEIERFSSIFLFLALSLSFA
jgi:hypothetical protein